MNNIEGFIKEFKILFPKCEHVSDFVCGFFDLFPKYNLDKAHRACYFIAQCAHESANFTVFKENLNYSNDGLRRVFPKYFKNKNVLDYARQPQKIANLVYANRMGNGDEQSGDGWKFRGRGLIQLTGKNNYSNFSKWANEDFVSNPDLLATDPHTAILSAIWFWDSNNLNQYADKADITSMTKRINGGLNGLNERKELFDKVFKAFQRFF